MVNLINIFNKTWLLFCLGCSLLSASVEIKTIQTPDQLSIRMGRWDSAIKDPSKPVVLLLPGLGESMDRVEPVIHSLNKLGFSVISLDWRGQGHSGRMTKISSLCHIPSFNLYLDDLKLVLDTLPPEQKILVLTNSMGGHLILRYIQEKGQDQRFIGLMLAAPMIKIHTGKYPWVVARSLSWLINKTRFNERFVFGYQPFSSGECFFNSAHVGDPSYHERTCAIDSEHPDRATGGPSFSWLESCFKSMDQLMKPEKIALITVPVFIVTAQRDHKVDNAAQREFCNRLSKCRLKEYDARHNLFLEPDSLQSEIWQDFFEFLC